MEFKTKVKEPVSSQNYNHNLNFQMPFDEVHVSYCIDCLLSNVEIYFEFSIISLIFKDTVIMVVTIPV